MSTVEVCERCAQRTWLLGRLAGHLEVARARIDELLVLEDRALVDAVAGDDAATVTAELTGHGASRSLAAIQDARIDAVCRCSDRYPPALRDLPGPPAVLHVGGGLARLTRSLQEHPVAIVGARRPSSYGRETATSLAGGLARAGLTVVSGMALGIDSAAHRGALEADRPTVAVLAGGVDVPYPASGRALHRRIGGEGAVVSELGPGWHPRRWMFPARNRLIAALGSMTVVIQAREHSGALLTAGWARRLGRPLGAVPGLIDAPLSCGPHALLREGATLVRGPQDVLDELYGVGAVTVATRRHAQLPPPLARLLEAIADGEQGSAALDRAGLSGEEGVVALARLELDGVLRRGPGGRYAIVD